jgi:hypothetical protein
VVSNKNPYNFLVMEELNIFVFTIRGTFAMTYAHRNNVLGMFLIVIPFENGTVN